MYPRKRHDHIVSNLHTCFGGAAQMYVMREKQEYKMGALNIKIQEL